VEKKLLPRRSAAYPVRVPTLIDTLSADKRNDEHAIQMRINLPIAGRTVQ
jgi:hypothetical protein